MALVTKNDVTQIFAIQAPSIDLPPTFANYPRGWDTARSNNGKPTIKQFNYIQQRTDQNVLWIHQNGAALPYDAAMEYAENAHVVKDGELQKKQGASWVSAANKGYNLDYFVSGKSYPLHAEIMLANGDIVKSTVADNITNPNVDMTGWVLVNSDSQIKTWSGRTQESKNKDSIHVLDFKIGKTDQQAIQDAVNYCIANEKSLNWDGANLTSTGNISNFWGVQHVGQGTITRDGSVFNIAPILAQVNNLYVSASGNDLNDGLSSNTAVRQPNAAVAYIENYANSYDGIYRINLTAGTFQRIRFNKALKFDIEIVGAATGGYPNVPTTLITEGASVAATGVILMSECFMKDIKIIGYNGSFSAQGISQSNARIKTNNVHVEDCYFGISAAGAGAKLTLESGKISNCGYLMGKVSGNPDSNGAGVRGMFHVKLEMGIQRSGTRNLEITGCSYGTRFQEFTTGHVDWCNINNNGVGIRQYTGSRVNATGTLFENNTRPYWLSDNSIINPSSTTEFINNASQSIVGEGCSNGLTSVSSGALFGFGEKFIRMLIVPQTIQTTSSGLIVDSISLKANSFKGLISNGAYYKKLKVRVSGSVTGTVGTKTIALRIGTTTAGLLNAQLAASATGMFIVDFEAIFMPSDGGILMNSIMRNGATSAAQTILKTQSMASDIDANINAYVANTADSILINAIEWSMVGI